VSETLLLTEYQEWIGDLLPEDRLFLNREFAKKITHRREMRAEVLRDVVNPNQYVGVLILPSGLRIELRPKIPTTNVFYMLAVAESLPFREELADYESLEEVLEFVVNYFATLAEERLTAGLYRSYCEAEDNLAFVRGRIDIAANIRENFALRHRTYCRYSELTWDVPENQVIRQVAHTLSGWQFRPRTRRRLAQLDTALAEVSPTRHTSDVVDRFTYSRLNDAYRAVHSLCRLFLVNSSVSESSGAFGFQSFLVDMNRLFEQFVTQVLFEATSGNGIWFASQRETHLDHANQVEMKPDFLLRGAGALIVGDCKYKRLDSGDFKNSDLYQMISYCTAEGSTRGVLVYPRHLVEADATVEVRRSPIRIEQLTLPLGGTLTDLKLASATLASLLIFGANRDNGQLAFSA